MDGPVPAHLREWWTADLCCLHSAAWWRRHWDRTGIVDIEVADVLSDGWRLWLDWLRLVAPDNGTEIRRWKPTPAATSVTFESWAAAGQRRNCRS